MVSSTDEADGAIVNTCGFIAPAVEESIDAILDLEILRRSGKLKFLGIVGCLVNRYEKDLRSEIPSADLFARVGDLETIAKAMNGGSLCQDRVLLPGSPAWTRYLKISEGCDNRCSYCTIPGIRGRLASVPPEEVYREAARLVSEGAKEICLVAQDLSAYGRDLGDRVDLGVLIDGFEDRFRGEDLWFRLLYLHPGRVGRGLIERVASSDLFLNYMDLPVQHASNRVLEAMNRGGSEGDRALGLFSFARSLDPRFALRTTLMVGFPGETDEDFEILLEFLQTALIDRVGVFPFYPEEGTPAAEMEGQVVEEVKMERMERLFSLQERISYERQRTFEGEVLKVLVDECHPGEGYLEGRSFREAPEVDGVVEASLKTAVRPGEFVKVKVLEALEHDLVGEVVAP
ncbi:MAG: Ribosomal protein S12 methylthiotransferase RimO [Synergistetes bacterium ADurb.Bin155]|nr:MAG: Ribosomal protein S12 methylthiotransferase RimO [Synergistetes bacterium ADurb.Bin155]